MLSLLLTGAAGYVGARLMPVLEARGHRACCVRRTDGYDLSKWGWTGRLPDHPVDVVVHLAQSRRYREFPAGAPDMFHVNVGATCELLEWARTHGVRRFVFASTGNVYDPSVVHAQEDSPCRPRSMYAASKLAAEHLLHPYQEYFSIVILRFFSIYGPQQIDGLISRMVSRVRDGTEITLAQATGPFLTPVFVDDAISAIAASCERPKERGLDVFNVAGDEVLSLAEIVGQIGQMVNAVPNVRTTDAEVGRFCGANGRAKEYLIPRFLVFVEGLRRMLEEVPDSAHR